jgi:ribosomal protein L32
MMERHEHNKAEEYEQKKHLPRKLKLPYAQRYPSFGHVDSKHRVSPSCGKGLYLQLV